MEKKFTHSVSWLFTVIFVILAVTSFSQVTNQTTSAVYSTIQAAVDDASAGDVILVSPGIYKESINVDKQIKIQGPKAGIDGNDPSRGTGEAIIYPPAVHYGDGTYNGGYLMRITADNVTVDGLTLDGDNPSLEGEYNANTGAFDIDFGIMSYWSVWYDLTDLTGDNLIIQNNVLRNFKLSAILMWAGYEGSTASSAILHNKIQNSASNPAINLGNNYYADVEYNTIVDCNSGVLISWYYNPKPVNIPGGIIKNNKMLLRTIVTNWGDTYSKVQGIWYHFIYSIADPWTISDNTLTNNSVAGPESSGIVITIDATEKPMVINNNDITGFENGYRLSTNYFGTTINGGTLTNNKYGVTVSNFYFNGNYPAGPSDFTLRNMNIQNSITAGVLLDDNETSQSHAEVNANIYNCFINGGPNGILLNGNPAYARQVHNNDLSGNSSFAINNLSPNAVDASCNWYGHWTGPAAEGNPNGTGSAVSAGIAYSPWVTSGTDVLTDPGFQSAPNSCVDIICGKSNDKYLICHKNQKSLCIEKADVEDHLAHGDSFGQCIMKSAEIPQEFSARVYPNPSHDNFNLHIESPDDGISEVKVFDLNGRIIREFSLESKKTYSFGEDLKPGVYFLRVHQSNEFKMIKVIKQ